MVLKALEEVFAGPSPFDLTRLKNFPFDQYEEQYQRYLEAERWFTGAALDDQPQNRDKADLYPMRVNPIISTVLKHAAVLIGEPEDDSRPLVYPKLVYDPNDENQKQQAEHAENVLTNIWWENRGRALIIENALLSQIYGGCVFKASYVPWEWEKWGGRRRIPILIETINPKNFVGIPYSGDSYTLVEAWFLKQIKQAEARKWGYSGTEESVWYVEHWTEDSYEVLINGLPASRNNQQIGGENPYKFVPAVYIPHVRVGDFLGFNAYSHLVGMVKELNRSWGDYGDAVNDDSHPTIAGRNIPGSVQIKRVNEWLEYVDIGSNPGISSNEAEPDLFQVNNQRASVAMNDMVRGIFQQYGRDSFVPPVAYGEDEGSQRSGLTLHIRFWPLTSHANLERWFWTPGLDVFQRYLLRMCLVKDLEDITKEHITMRMKQIWAPMLPRDRDAMVNEWGVRASNTIASVEHLIELSGDVENVPEERQNILNWIRDVEKEKLKAQHEHELELQEAQAKEAQKLEKIKGETQVEVAKERPAFSPMQGGRNDS